MQSKSKPQSILIIDRQDYWRMLCAETLEGAGFAVQTLSTYDYPRSSNHPQEEIPDLVILGCTNVGPQEEQLVKRILERDQLLLVLSIWLPRRVMRTLFLAGVDDVLNKSYDSDHLISIVHRALQSTSVLNPYQSVARRDML